MPSDTFYNLTDDKKEKIIDAAEKEFSRVSPEEILVKNIVKDAGIARGSFYQYFDSKDDLLYYLLKKDIDKIKQFVFVKLEKGKIDIFDFYISLFDFITKKIFTTKRVEFHERIIKSLKISDGKFVALYEIFSKENEIEIPHKKISFIENIDKENLNVKSNDELEDLIEMLFFITSKSLCDCFKYSSFEKSREKYLNMIGFLKNGVVNNVKN